LIQIVFTRAHEMLLESPLDLISRNTIETALQNFSELDTKSIIIAIKKLFDFYIFQRCHEQLDRVLLSTKDGSVEDVAIEEVSAIISKKSEAAIELKKFLGV